MLIWLLASFALNISAVFLVCKRCCLYAFRNDTTSLETQQFRNLGSIRFKDLGEKKWTQRRRDCCPTSTNLSTLHSYKRTVFLLHYTGAATSPRDPNIWLEYPKICPSVHPGTEFGYTTAPWWTGSGRWTVAVKSSKMVQLSTGNMGPTCHS